MTRDEEINEKIEAYFRSVSDEQLLRDFEEVSCGDSYVAPDIVLTDEFYQELERSKAIQAAMQDFAVAIKSIEKLVQQTNNSSKIQSYPMIEDVIQSVTISSGFIVSPEPTTAELPSAYPLKLAA